MSSNVRPNSRVLVAGLGAIGQFSALISKLRGAQVWASDPIASRRELATRISGAIPIDPGADDIAARVEETAWGSRPWPGRNGPPRSKYEQLRWAQAARCAGRGHRRDRAAGRLRGVRAADRKRGLPLPSGLLRDPAYTRLPRCAHEATHSPLPGGTGLRRLREGAEADVDGGRHRDGRSRDTRWPTRRRRCKSSCSRLPSSAVSAVVRWKSEEAA